MRRTLRFSARLFRPEKMSVKFLTKTQKLAETSVIATCAKDPVCPSKGLVPNPVGLKSLWTVHKFKVDKKTFRYGVYHLHKDVWGLAGVFLAPASKLSAGAENS